MTKLPPPFDHLNIEGADPESLMLIQRDKVQEIDLLAADAEWQDASPYWAMPRWPRILVFTPCHPSYTIRSRTLASVGNAVANYAGPVDWMLTANDNRHVSAYENVTAHHNRARQLTLLGGYDAMLSIEADMIIPPDTITKLVQVSADIVYGLYVLRHKLRRWSAYKTVTLWGGESISYNHDGKEARAAWGNIIDVVGLGMGCTLIRRPVLEALEFRLHDGRQSWINEEYADDFEKLGINSTREHKDMVCDDWLLAMDAQHYGFTQKAHLGVVCGHIDGNVILWPDPQAAKFYRIENV